MPEVNLGAGDLRERIHFQRRVAADDGFGNVLASGAFETVFTVSANLRPLRGSESVMQSRLAGKQPYIVTVRSSSETREADESWQLVDARKADRIFAVKAPPTDPNGRRAWLEFLVTEGEAS